MKLAWANENIRLVITFNAHVLILNPALSDRIIPIISAGLVLVPLQSCLLD